MSDLMNERCRWFPNPEISLGIYETLEKMIRPDRRSCSGVSGEKLRRLHNSTRTQTPMPNRIARR